MKNNAQYSAHLFPVSKWFTTLFQYIRNVFRDNFSEIQNGRWALNPLSNRLHELDHKFAPRLTKSTQSLGDAFLDSTNESGSSQNDSDYRPNVYEHYRAATSSLASADHGLVLLHGGLAPKGYAAAAMPGINCPQPQANVLMSYDYTAHLYEPLELLFGDGTAVVYRNYKNHNKWCWTNALEPAHYRVVITDPSPALPDPMVKFYGNGDVNGPSVSITTIEGYDLYQKFEVIQELELQVQLSEMALSSSGLIISPCSCMCFQQVIYFQLSHF